MSCSLCSNDFHFYIAFCRSHPDQILIVGIAHRPNFTDEEKELIKKMFPDRSIRWEMKSIPQHAHCHVT